MKAGGVIINDVPRIHCVDPIAYDHSVSFDQHNMRIPLQLNVVFSHFHTRVLTKKELHECEKLLLTQHPIDWNLHCQSYE